MNGKHTLALMCILYATGCADTDDQEDLANQPSAVDEPQALRGAATTLERPEVGLLHVTRTYPEESVNCTATLFENGRRILTAAHCLPRIGFGSEAVFWIYPANGQERQTFPVKYLFALEDSSGWPGSHDLAVGILETEVPASLATPAQLASSAAGGPYTTMGFGCTDFTDQKAGQGEKRFRTDSDLKSNNLCPGDSGGPVFLGGLTDRGAVYRVNSGHQDFQIRDDYDIHGQVDTYHEEIKAVARAIDRNSAKVCYRVHVDDIGWMKPVCDGAIAGTTNQGRAIQALQAWSPDGSRQVCYSAHLAQVGWTGWGCDGEVVGTVGESRDMQAFAVDITNAPESYQAHVQGKGWLPAVSSSQPAGTEHESRRLEALKITAN